MRQTYNEALANRKIQKNLPIKVVLITCSLIRSKMKF